MPQEKYILVVDDEPNIREFVKRSLEKHGFKVKLANNGWDALAEFEHTNFVLLIFPRVAQRGCSLGLLGS